MNHNKPQESDILKSEIEYEGDCIYIYLDRLNQELIIDAHDLCGHFKLELTIKVETGHIGTRWSGGALPKFEEEWQTRTATEAVEEELELSHIWEYIQDGGRYELENVY